MGSDATGDILYYNGTDYTRLPKGTEGQVLSINSSGQPAWIEPYPKAYHTNVTAISTITMSNTLTWYDTPLSVTVPVSSTSTKFVISAQLVGENSLGLSYPFSCRIKTTHTDDDGTVTELNHLVGADDVGNTGAARTPITVPMNALYENHDTSMTTEESFTIPAVVHTPNVNNGTVTYLLQIRNNGAESATTTRYFYINRTGNDRSGNKSAWTIFERSLSYITALPVT